MELGRASITKFTKTGNYLISCFSGIKMGGSIATEPIIRLEDSEPINEVMNQILYAMSCSKSNLSNPNWKTHNTEYLRLAGVNRDSDLYENVIYVFIFKKDDIITFSPTINNGAKGFVFVPNAEINISAHGDILELSSALQEAFNRCK